MRVVIKVFIGLLIVISLIYFPYTLLNFQKEVTLIAVGDVMLGRRVEPVLDKYGYSFLTREVKPLFENADIVFANLESPITNKQNRYIEKKFIFRAKPNSIKVLREMNLDIVNLANNHIMDYGYSGLEETREILRKNKIKFIGAGTNLQEARRPSIISKNGIKFGFLGYSTVSSKQISATDLSGGVVPANISYIKEDIENLKKRTDIIVVSFHWGREYENRPTAKQQEIAHKCIDFGADIVLGHHPHVLQAIQLYKGKLITYSLGNFIFDQKKYITRHSIILTCIFKKRGLRKFYITPIWRTENTYYPRLIRGEWKNKIFTHLQELSAELGTALDESHINEH